MLKKSCAIIASVILAATLVFTGCSESDNSTSQTASASSVSQDSGSPDGSDISGITKVSSDKNDLYTERDLQQTADTSSAKSVTVSDGQTIDITEEGVYVISGTAKNCTVKVNAPDNAKIQLVLDGVSITNDDFPAIYVVSADKCFVTTTDKQNDNRHKGCRGKLSDILILGRLHKATFNGPTAVKSEPIHHQKRRRKNCSKSEKQTDDFFLFHSLKKITSNRCRSIPEQFHAVKRSAFADAANARRITENFSKRNIRFQKVRFAIAFDFLHLAFACLDIARHKACKIHRAF